MSLWLGPCTYLTDLMCEHHTECRACLESSFLGSPNPGGTVQFSQLVRDADSSTCMVGLGFQPSVAQLNGQLVTHIPHPAVHDATAGVHLGARRQRPGRCLKSNNKAANTGPSSCPSRHKARSISQTHSGAEVIAELLRVVLGIGVKSRKFNTSNASAHPRHYKSRRQTHNDHPGCDKPRWKRLSHIPNQFSFRLTPF